MGGAQCQARAVITSPTAPSSMSSLVRTTSGQYWAFSATRNTGAGLPGGAPGCVGTASSVGAMGFSSSTCLPARSAATANSSCRRCGTMIRAASKVPAGEGVVEGGERLGPRLRGHGPGPVTVDVDRGGDLGPGRGGAQRRQVPLGDGAATDEGQPQATLGRREPARPWGATLRGRLWDPHEPQAVLPGPIRQNGYVVRDLGRAIDAWLDVGVGPWLLLPHLTQIGLGLPGPADGAGGVHRLRQLRRSADRAHRARGRLAQHLPGVPRRRSRRFPPPGLVGRGLRRRGRSRRATPAGRSSTPATPAGWPSSPTTTRAASRARSSRSWS